MSKAKFVKFRFKAGEVGTSIALGTAENIDDQLSVTFIFNDSVTFEKAQELADQLNKIVTGASIQYLDK